MRPGRRARIAGVRFVQAVSGQGSTALTVATQSQCAWHTSGKRRHQRRRPTACARHISASVLTASLQPRRQHTQATACAVLRNVATLSPNTKQRPRRKPPTACARRALPGILATALRRLLCARPVMQQRWVPVCAPSALRGALLWLAARRVRNACPVRSLPPAVAHALRAQRGSLRPRGGVLPASRGRRAHLAKALRPQDQALQTVHVHRALWATRSRRKTTRRSARLSRHARHGSKKRSPRLRGQTAFARPAQRVTRATAVQNARRVELARLQPMAALCARRAVQVGLRPGRGLRHAKHATTGAFLREQRASALVGARAPRARARSARAHRRRIARVLRATPAQRGRLRTTPRHVRQ